MKKVRLERYNIIINIAELKIYIWDIECVISYLNYVLVKTFIVENFWVNPVTKWTFCLLKLTFITVLAFNLLEQLIKWSKVENDHESWLVYQMLIKVKLT